MDAQPPEPARPSDAAETDADEPSWWQSLQLILALSFGVRALGWFVDDGSLRLKLQIALVVGSLAFAATRTAILRFALMVMVLVVLVHAAQHPRDIERDGWGSVARVALARAFRVAVERVGEFRVASAREPYLRAVHVVRATQGDPILAIADDVARDCGDGDYGCEVRAITAAVRGRVTYRSDPAGTTRDFVQQPLVTWNRGAGDCEDQAILSLSLLRAHGIAAYAAFSPQHMFAVACAHADEVPAFSTDRSDCRIVDTTASAEPQSLASIRRYGSLDLYDASGRRVFSSR